MSKNLNLFAKTLPTTALTKEIGYTFKDKSLIDRARTHRSVHSAKKQEVDYERLEFLGDAVLDLSIAHILIDRFPHMKEGDLSKLRAALVNAQTLSQIARRIKLGRYIRLSKGEANTGGADRPSILADVLEAVIGAVYRDGGFEKALEVVIKLFGKYIDEVKPQDPKTELQEVLHAIGMSAPVYKLLESKGPEHDPVFVSVVEVDNQEQGRGEGKTKKASQQAAALMFLQKLKLQSKKSL